MKAAFEAETKGDLPGAHDCWRQIAALERANPGPMHVSYLMQYASSCLALGRASSGTESDDHRSSSAVFSGAEVPRPARSYESEAFAVVEEARQGLQPGPDPAWLQFMVAWGSMLSQAGRHVEAVAVYRELTDRTFHSEYRRYSDYYEAHVTLIQLLADGLGDRDAAREEAETLVARFQPIEGDGPLSFSAERVFRQVLFAKATLEGQTGRPEDAVRTLRDLLDRIERDDPEGADARVVREALARAAAAGPAPGTD